MPRFEVHSHTCYSNLRLLDSTNKPENLIDRAISLGLSGIAITDHEALCSHIKCNQYQQKIENDYPFKLKVEIDNGNMTPNGGTAQIKFSLVWPFESGDDELDTEWGHKAYAYHENNPDSKSITLVIKVTAIQVND